MTDGLPRECCIYGCHIPSTAMCSNATTERLHESWACCHVHIPTVIRYLVERDTAWSRNSGGVVVQQIARG